MLKLIIKKLSEHAVTDLLKRNAALQDENTILRRENAKFLGVVSGKQQEIVRLKGQLAGRDRILADYRRDEAGRFA